MVATEDKHLFESEILFCTFHFFAVFREKMFRPTKKSRGLFKTKKSNRFLCFEKKNFLNARKVKKNKYLSLLEEYGLETQLLRAGAHTL